MKVPLPLDRCPVCGKHFESLSDVPGGAQICWAISFTTKVGLVGCRAEWKSGGISYWPLGPRGFLVVDFGEAL